MRTHSRIYILCALGLLATQVGSGAQTCDNILGVSIGVTGKSGTPYALADAQRFVAHWKDSGWRNRVNFVSGSPLADPDAAHLAFAIEDALYQVNTRDCVVIFISGLGYVKSGEGFIGAKDFDNRGIGTAFPLQRLKGMIEDRDPHVVLFADLARPAGSGSLINSAFKVKLDKTPKFHGILANQSQTCDEDKVASQFGCALRHLLEQGIKTPNSPLTLGTICKQVGSVSCVGSMAEVTIPQLQSRRRQSGRRARYPGLLPVAFGRTAATEETQTSALASQAGDEKLRGSLARKQAVELESEGQKVITMYGGGDRFPDPALLTKSRFERAAELFEQASALRGGRPDLEWRRLFCKGRARLYDAQGRAGNQAFAEAEELLVRASRIQPKTPEPYTALGIGYFERGEYAKAIVEFRKAINVEPAWPYPRQVLALSHMYLGEFERAEKEYLSAIQLAPDYPYLHYNLARVLQLNGKLSESEEEFAIALQKFPLQAEQYRALATVRRDEGQDEDADEFDNRAKLIATQQTAEAYNALGALWQQRGQLDKAEAEFRRALTLTDLAAARHNLALVLTAQRQNAEAEQLLEQNRNFLPSILLMAETFEGEKRFGEAEARYREALARRPDLFRARLGLAQSLAKQEKYSEAGASLIEYGKSATNVGERFQLAYTLGDIYTQAKNIAAACEQYHLAWTLAPNIVDDAATSKAKKQVRSCDRQRK